jgi:hypothetical protein
MRAAGRKTEAADMVHFGEALAQVKGFGEGFAPALKAAAGSVRTGVTTLFPGENNGATCQVLCQGRIRLEA